MVAGWQTAAARRRALWPRRAAERRKAVQDRAPRLEIASAIGGVAAAGLARRERLSRPRRRQRRLEAEDCAAEDGERKAVIGWKTATARRNALQPQHAAARRETVQD